MAEQLMRRAQNREVSGSKPRSDISIDSMLTTIGYRDAVATLYSAQNNAGKIGGHHDHPI